MSNLRRLVFASVSGLLCYFVFDFGFDGRWPEPLFYSVSGTLFASGVLFPFLVRDRIVWYRGFGLVAASSLSYWFAIETALLTLDSKGFPGTKSYLAASLVGALIALTAARFTCPLKSSMALAVIGFPAAIVGGLAFSILPNDWPDLAFALPFLIWHCLMATAIHIAENWKSQIGAAH